MRALAVLASGQGSNFEALVHAERAGSGPGLGGRIVALFCDQPGAPVIDRARKLGVEVVLPPTGALRTRLEDEGAWVDALRSRGVEVVLLAGFMRRLHATLLGAFPSRILNLHPSLLPAFPGLDSIRQAFEHGIRVTGCTVHVVNEGLDQGPIVAQAVVDVLETDTLETLEVRVHQAEHRLYPWAVRRFLGEPWRIEGRRLVFELPVGARDG